MKIRGTSLSLALVALTVSCGDTPPTNQKTSVPVESVTEPTASGLPPADESAPPVVQPFVPIEIPPEDYEGPVRGRFLDGKIFAQEFVPVDMIWDKARIDFNIGDEQWPDQGIRLAWLKRDRYTVPFGMKFSVDKEHPVPPADKFEIWIRYRIPDTRAQKQKKVEFPYTLKVELDPDSGDGGITGYVDFESAEPPLALRGRFEARFKGERTMYGVSDPTAGSPATLAHLFDLQFKEQFPDAKFKITRVGEMSRAKTVNKLMRLGYLEIGLDLDGERTFRNALMVRTLDGWDCVEVLEPWQIGEAFPILEPQAPPNGGLRPYLNFVIADLAQRTIEPGTNVFNYENELLFGGTPLSWCLSKVRYRTSAKSKASVSREFVLRKTELGWLVEAELGEDEALDQATGEIVQKREGVD